MAEVRDIPVVMICVLVASLLECFVVLPAHLRNAFSPRAGCERRPGPLGTNLYLGVLSRRVKCYHMARYRCRDGFH